MLQRLIIKNIALIENLEIEFASGLNILTGETGAGKSIVIDAIGVVLGSRISKDIIRTGQDTAYVEAFFEIRNTNILLYLKENQLYEDDVLILSREFNAGGKNVCRVNGRVVTSTILKEIGQMLVDMHGQYDNQSLLNVSSHIDFLDSFGGNHIDIVKRQYTKLYQSIKELKEKINKLGPNGEERERKLDLLRFQVDEIENGKLKIGEDFELEEQKKLMLNSEKLVSNIEKSYDILNGENSSGSIVSDLRLVIKQLEGIAQYDNRINPFFIKAQDLFYLSEDLVQEIREYKDNLEFNPDDLEYIDERLDTISRLKRKYGSTIEEILGYKDNLLNELQEFEYSEELLNTYNSELKELNQQIERAALELSTARKEIAGKLEGEIVKELEDLEMKKTKFKVDFEEGEIEYTSKGIDKVEFLISPNAGEKLKPLSKIASGGEMSRIMLAIKTILASIDQIPVLIFDEIDNGISGKAAQMVGQKLSIISKNHQVLCITHLSQIASMADEHYLVEKYVEKNVTNTRVRKLNQEERVHEIARIIGGAKITETTIKNAKEMLAFAKDSK